MGLNGLQSGNTQRNHVLLKTGNQTRRSLAPVQIRMCADGLAVDRSPGVNEGNNGVDIDLPRKRGEAEILSLPHTLWGRGGFSGEG